MKTKAPKKLSDKKIDALIDTLYRRNFTGVQIPMLEIPRLFRVARAAYLTSFEAGVINGGVIDPTVIETSILVALREAVDAIKVVS